MQSGGIDSIAEGVGGGAALFGAWRRCPPLFAQGWPAHRESSGRQQKATSLCTLPPKKHGESPSRPVAVVAGLGPACSRALAPWAPAAGAGAPAVCCPPSALAAMAAVVLVPVPVPGVSCFFRPGQQESRGLHRLSAPRRWVVCRVAVPCGLAAMLLAMPNEWTKSSSVSE
jgi:hypothetical protein